MKRITEKVDGAWTAICEYGNPPYPVVTQDVIDRLAAYEDTGLEPEEIVKIRKDIENGYMKSTARPAIRKQISEISIFLNRFYKHTYNNPPQKCKLWGWKEENT